MALRKLEDWQLTLVSGGNCPPGGDCDPDDSEQENEVEDNNISDHCAKEKKYRGPCLPRRRKKGMKGQFFFGIGGKYRGRIMCPLTA